MGAHMNKLTWLCVGALMAAPAFADDKKVVAKSDAKAVEKKPAEKAMEAPPPPAKELTDAMAPMEGAWKCSGKALDSAMGKGHPMEVTSTFTRDLGGYWFVNRFDEVKTKDSPMPYAMWSTIGFDASKKQLMRADIDNFGGVTHASSKGWEGDKLVWEGNVTGGMPMGFRETVTRKGKELATVIEFSINDKWGPGVEYTCKK